MKWRISRGRRSEKGFLRRWPELSLRRQERGTQLGKNYALGKREYISSVSCGWGSCMLNSLVLLSSIKDQSPITQNRCILMDCRTREYSEIGDSSQGIDVCREERERVSRYHEGTNSVRGRKNGRGDKERRMLNPLLASFTALSLLISDIKW